MSLKSWMDQNGVKQGEVAEAIGKSRKWVNLLANGREQPSAEVITNFYFAFGEEATVQAFDTNGKVRA